MTEFGYCPSSIDINSVSFRSMRILLFYLCLLLTAILPCHALDSSLRQSAKVTRIVDGDTIDLEVGKRQEALRLIGIDTPESRDNDKARRDSSRSGVKLSEITSQGRRASAFLAALVPLNTILSLEFDVETRDKYGRLLAYAYLPDGRMLNEVILKSGYASLMSIPPNVKNVEKFRKAYEAARKSGVGLWAKD